MNEPDFTPDINFDMLDLTQSLAQTLSDIQDEAWRAQAEHGNFNSDHEALAVIWEEFAELKAEIFKKEQSRSQANLYNEAIQVAATAARYALQIRHRYSQEMKRLQEES